MKTKLKKTLFYFFNFLLPLCWVMGFAAAMIERYEPVKTNTFLYISIRAALIVLILQVSMDTRSRGIKGWYSVVCLVAAIGIAALSMWVHYTL